MIKIKDSLLTICGILYYKFFYKNFIFKTSKEISDYQFKKLKKLLISSNLNVPYYNKLFKKINFDPLTDFKSLNDLKKIPILEQEVVRKNPGEFINKKSKNFSSLNTSGTSGQPFTALVDDAHWVVEQAVIWRQWKSFGYKFRDKIALLRSYTPEKNDTLIKVDYLRNFIYYSPYHLSDENCADFYKDMVRREIKFLRGYPSSIKIFTSYCKRNQLKINSLKGILLASETLLENDKKYIKDYFNVPVINHYGLAECVVMIGNIFSDKHLYNYDDYGYLELIKYGNNINIIGTNLNNHAMPLIRYNTNDMALIDSNNEDKKIKLKQIKSITGRQNEYIITNKEKIPLTNIYTIFSKHQNIAKWQIVQRRINKLDVLLLCAEKDKDIIKEKLINDLSILERKDININVIFTSEFERFGEGKIPPFIPYDKK